MDSDSKIVWLWIYRILGISLLLIILSLWGCPQYNVWQQRLEGEAEFKRAEENRKIKIEEAKAHNEAAISMAEAKVKMANAENEAAIIKAKGYAIAEVERAKGVAEANKIIGESLKNNKDYLHYLWIDQLHKGQQKVYIPTEAGLPILEAGK